MNVIICLDDKNGVSFNHRRQSRDRAVTEDILKMAQGHRIFIRPDSSILFEEFCAEKDNSEKAEVIVEDEDLFINAAAEDYIFLECADVNMLPQEMHQLIIYRWNRVYPADIHFAIPEACRQTETMDFPGYSHEKITREIYEIQ